MFTTRRPWFRTSCCSRNCPTIPTGFALVRLVQHRPLPTIISRTSRRITSRSSAAWAVNQVRWGHLWRRLLRPCRGRDAEPPLRPQDGGGPLPRRSVMWQDVASGAGSQGASCSYASAVAVGCSRACGPPIAVRDGAHENCRTRDLLADMVFLRGVPVRGWVGCSAPAVNAGGIVAEALRSDGRRRQRAASRNPRHLRITAARDIAFSKRSRRGGPVWLDVIKSLNIAPHREMPTA